jgi:hypothetical protein
MNAKKCSENRIALLSSGRERCSHDDRERGNQSDTAVNIRPKEAE